MPIQNQIRVIHRVEEVVAELQKKYSANAAASLDLDKLHHSIKELTVYLTHLDQLQPNYNTNDIKPYIEAINLRLDILKEELDKKDFQKLSNGIKVIRLVLKFHPTKYSLFTFIIAWCFELMYFI